MMSMAPMPAHTAVGHLTGGAAAALVVVFAAWFVGYRVLRWTLDRPSRSRQPVPPRELVNRIKYPCVADVRDARRQIGDSNS